MIQIRKGIFETNSSSVHSIQISKDNDDFLNNLPEKLGFTGGEFGWEWCNYIDYQNKFNYLVIGIESWANTPEEFNAYWSKICSILNKWNIEVEFPEVVQKPGYIELSRTKYGYCYIDHVNELGRFIEKVVNDETLLMTYLFSPTSYVSTGNDNEDDDWFIYPKDGKEILLGYEKEN